jgi:hypothetical protein
VKTITRERDQAIAARHIAAAATVAGVLPSSVDDVINRALSSGDWLMDRRSGDLVRHSDDYPDIDGMSGDKITAGKFINRLREDAPNTLAVAAVRAAAVVQQEASIRPRRIRGMPTLGTIWPRSRLLARIAQRPKRWRKQPAAMSGHCRRAWGASRSTDQRRFHSG